MFECIDTNRSQRSLCVVFQSFQSIIKSKIEFYLNLKIIRKILIFNGTMHVLILQKCNNHLLVPTDSRFAEDLANLYQNVYCIYTESDKFILHGIYTNNYHYFQQF